MAKTYYVWAGVGEILDADGDDLPAAADGPAAVAAFAALPHDGRDLTLWERDGAAARLLAARINGRVMSTVSRGVTAVFRTGL